MPRVFAATYLVGLLEWACMEAMRPHLELGEQSVGMEAMRPHLELGEQSVGVVRLAKMLTCERAGATPRSLASAVIQALTAGMARGK